MVYGSRHTVNVPLNQGSGGGGMPRVEPHPEAQALKASMQQAVRSGAVASQDAAARLVALLRKGREAQQLLEEQQQQQQLGEAMTMTSAAVGRQLPAGSTTTKAPPPGFSFGHQGTSMMAPPPGFGGGGSGLGGGGGGLSPLIDNSDPAVSGPALGRYLPIQPPPPILSPTIQLFAAAPGTRPLSPHPSYDPATAAATSAASSSNNLLQQLQQQPPLLGSGGRAYSMWSGLPGIDLGLGSSLWPGGGGSGGGLGGGGYGGNGLYGDRAPVLGGPVGLHGSGGGALSSLDLPASGYLSGGGGGGGGPRAPPPGFGPAAPMSRPYQPFGSTVSTANSNTAGGSNGLLGGYNPIQAAQQQQQQQGVVGGQRAPPPGMAAYRPQLGTGL